jgi:hypothetical protein
MEPTPSRMSGYPFTSVSVFPDQGSFGATIYISTLEQESPWTHEELRTALILGLQQHLGGVDLNRIYATEYTETSETLVLPDPETPINVPPVG